MTRTHNELRDGPAPRGRHGARLGDSRGGGVVEHSPKQWAGGVCSAVQTFGDSVDATISGLKGSDSLDSATQEAKSGLQSAVTELEDVTHDPRQAVDRRRKKAQTAVQDLSDELSKNVAAIQECSRRRRALRLRSRRRSLTSGARSRRQ